MKSVIDELALMRENVTRAQTRVIDGVGRTGPSMRCGGSSAATVLSSTSGKPAEQGGRSERGGPPDRLLINGCPASAFLCQLSFSSNSTLARSRPRFTPCQLRTAFL